MVEVSDFINPLVGPLFGYRIISMANPPRINTSDPSPMMTQPCVQYSGVKASMNSSVSPLMINPENVRSVCESILTHQPSQSHKLEVMVVSSTSSSNSSQSEAEQVFTAPIVSHTVKTAESRPTAENRSLSEIVSKERDSLFHGKSSNVANDFEVEPARTDLLAVRRRSRQFFVLREEEEDDTEVKTTLTTQTDIKEIEITDNKSFRAPVFNLGESLRRLYYPHDQLGKNKRKVQKIKDSETEQGPVPLSPINEPRNRMTCGYESDPEECVRLYKKVTVNPAALRKIQSHPELGELDHPEEDFEDVLNKPSFHSKSLPITPRLSPRLVRKALTSEQKDVQVPKSKPDPAGPGFSFLSKVAGQLRVHKEKKAQQDQAVVAKISKSHKVRANLENTVAVAKPQSTLAVYNENGVEKPTVPSTNNTEKQTKPANNTIIKEGSSDKPDTNKKSLMKSVISWGTTSKVTVSKKESNLFSPSSF